MKTLGAMVGMACTLPVLAAAERVPHPVEKFMEPMTYVVEGVSMYVNCGCFLEEPKAFDIGVEATFEQLPIAAEVAVDVAQGYCEADHGSKIVLDIGSADFNFVMRYEAELSSWQLSGRCE